MLAWSVFFVVLDMFLRPGAQVLIVEKVYRIYRNHGLNQIFVCMIGCSEFRRFLKAKLMKKQLEDPGKISRKSPVAAPI